MPRRRSASLTAPGAALRWREGPTSPLCKHLEQLIPLWLWIAPPVATEHPDAPSSLNLPPTAGSGIGGEAGELDRPRCCGQNWLPGLVPALPRVDSPRPRGRGASTPSAPSKPALSGLCRICAPQMFHGRGTQYLVFPARRQTLVEHSPSICPPSAGATCCPGDGWGTSAARQAVGFRLVEAAFLALGVSKGHAPLARDGDTEAKRRCIHP